MEKLPPLKKGPTHAHANSRQNRDLHIHNTRHRARKSAPSNAQLVRQQGPSVASSRRPAADSSCSTGDQSDERNEKNYICRFRCIAKMVKNQLVWFQTLKEAEEHLKTYVADDNEKDEQHSLTFNAAAFKPDVQSFSILTPKAKALLQRPSHTRSKQELEYLEQFTLRLKCFDRYSKFVRKQLAGVLLYQQFEKGRVVIRQGDKGFNFYFIVSGGVLIEVQEEDPTTGGKHINIMGELGPGASFGELALIHETKRRATIVCKEDTEFLTIDKPDFDAVLGLSHEMEWNTRMNILKSHPYFKDWSTSSLQMVAEGSRIHEYPPNSIIIKNLALSKDNDVIYLVVKGTCNVVQKLKMLEYDNEDLREKTVVLPPIGDPCLRQKNVVRRWLVVKRIFPGEMFGLGEGGPDISVITDQRVDCLAINKMVIARNDTRNALSANLCGLYPSRDFVFKKYIDLCQWKEYRHKAVKEAISKGNYQQQKIVGLLFFD